MKRTTLKMSIHRVLIILTIYENIYIWVCTFKLFSQMTVLGIIIAFMRVLSNWFQMIKFLLGRKWPLCLDEHQEEGATNKGRLSRRGGVCSLCLFRLGWRWVKRSQRVFLTRFREFRHTFKLLSPWPEKCPPGLRIRKRIVHWLEWN